MKIDIFCSKVEAFSLPHTHTKGERQNENIKEYISANIQKVKIDIEEAAAVPTDCFLLLLRKARTK